MHKILIVDDDIALLTANERYLKAYGYLVHTADCGRTAIKEAAENTFDCIILDVMLTDMDGFEVCQEIRKKSKAPIIFLSCKSEEEDKIHGLMSGGDDYMTKPFSLKEMAARIHVQIRRNSYPEPFVIDKTNRAILSSGQSVSMTKKEFEIFSLLYENEGKDFTTNEIYQSLWSGEKSDSGKIAVHIKNLRDKLAQLPMRIGQIESAYKRGYRFIREDKD